MTPSESEMASSRHNCAIHFVSTPFITLLHALLLFVYVLIFCTFVSPRNCAVLFNKMNIEIPADPALAIEKGCVLITEAGNHFGCADMTTAKAMLIYHHYQIVRNKMTVQNLSFDIGFQLYATAAFGISYKVCGEQLKMEEVVKFFERLGLKGKDPVDYEALTRQVARVEFDIHCTVFDSPYMSKKKAIDVPDKWDVAHRFVLSYMDVFVHFGEIQSKIISVKTTSLKFLNTFYHCRKCINYKPLELAWAAIHLSFRMFDLQIEDNRMIKKEFDAAVNPGTHQKVMNEMSVVCAYASRKTYT